MGRGPLSRGNGGQLCSEELHTRERRSLKLSLIIVTSTATSETTESADCGLCFAVNFQTFKVDQNLCYIHATSREVCHLGNHLTSEEEEPTQTLPLPFNSFFCRARKQL